MRVHPTQLHQVLHQRVPAEKLFDRHLSDRTTPSLDATKEGFLAALKDAGIVQGENLKVDDSNAQGEPSNNLTIAQKIAEKHDLALGIATPSALALADNVTEAVLFAAVTDPLDAQIVSNLDKPGGNFTGLPTQIQRLLLN